jgi:hypothetical protein
MVNDKITTVDKSFVKGSIVKVIDEIIDNDRYSLTVKGNMHEFVNKLTLDDIKLLLSEIESGDTLFRNFDRYMFLRLLFVEGINIKYSAPLLANMLYSSEGVSKNELSAWIIDTSANLKDPPWKRVNFISKFLALKNHMLKAGKKTYLELEQIRLEENAADTATEAYAATEAAANRDDTAAAEASAALMSSAD